MVKTRFKALLEPFCLFSGFLNSKISTFRTCYSKLLYTHKVHVYTLLMPKIFFGIVISSQMRNFFASPVIFAFFCVFSKNKIFKCRFFNGKQTNSKKFEVVNYKIAQVSPKFFLAKNLKNWPNAQLSQGGGRNPGKISPPPGFSNLT